MTSDVRTQPTRRQSREGYRVRKFSIPASLYARSAKGVNAETPILNGPVFGEQITRHRCGHRGLPHEALAFSVEASPVYRCTDIVHSTLPGLLNQALPS